MHMRRHKTLIFVLILLVIAVAIYFLSREEAIAPESVLDTQVEEDVNISVLDTNPIELCFAKFGEPNINVNGYFDKYTLRLILDGEKVTGELNLLPAGTDSKTGELKGTVTPVDKTAMSRVADLEWFTFAEGMNDIEKIKIEFGEGTASIHGLNLELADVACADLVERASVETYLRDNITELSPVDAILGGTWYVASVTIDLEKNSGKVVYEDGHMEERRDFYYTTNAQGEVINLEIK